MRSSLVWLQVHDLPLNNRSLIELAPLQAGIVAATTTSPGTSKGMGTKLAISGTRYNANLFQVDGPSINDLAGDLGVTAGYSGNRGY